jgi:hypothetical protein
LEQCDTSKFKKGDKVVVEYSNYDNVKKGDTLTIEDFDGIFLYFKETKLITSTDFWGLVVNFCIPNNPLSRIVYPELSPTDCGEWLC